MVQLKGNPYKMGVLCNAFQNLGAAEIESLLWHKKKPHRNKHSCGKSNTDVIIQIMQRHSVESQKANLILHHLIIYIYSCKRVENQDDKHCIF